MVGDDTTPECLETGHLTRVKYQRHRFAPRRWFTRKGRRYDRDRPRNLRLRSQEAADCASFSRTQPVHAWTGESTFQSSFRRKFAAMRIPASPLRSTLIESL
jgi:hypothetical protein